MVQLPSMVSVPVVLDFPQVPLLVSLAVVFSALPIWVAPPSLEVSFQVAPSGFPSVTDSPVSEIPLSALASMGFPVVAPVSEGQTSASPLSCWD